MNLQHQICSAFCDGFRVSEVPIGYAITSPFKWLNEDPLTFYVRKKENKFRIEDSGSSILLLEDAAGDLTSESRVQTIRELAFDHRIVFDEEQTLFFSDWIAEEKIGSSVVDFLSFMNRLQDLQFLARERVESAFKEDLIAAIHERFAIGYTVSERSEITSSKSGYVADILITSEYGKNAAIYAATAEIKVLEAIIAGDLIRHEELSKITPILVFEDFVSSPISQKNKKRSMNSGILKLADWSGGKQEVIDKIDSCLAA